jgi:ADP-ribose pyrophosphatase YjhB (NUDIX family)
MNFCSHCGSPIGRATPAGDQRERFVCDVCGTIFYENPKVVVGCVLEWNAALLLCRRAIEPRSGFWTLPAGFLENGESTAEGALRETIEESGADAEIERLFAIIDVPAIHQVHIFYRGRLRSSELAPGIETTEAGFFPADRIPWNELAFSSVRHVLEAYLADRETGRFGTHSLTLPVPQSRRK